ncbi:MAG: DUF2080 family transposase-associated protein [Bacilli bacterium]|jgi:putative transposon-encoded protein
MTIFDTTSLEYARPIDLLEPASQDEGPRYIVLAVDWDAVAITAETRDPTATAVSERQWHGRVSAYCLPPTVDAARLRGWVEAEVVPRAIPLAEVYETEWDGDNYVAAFPGCEEEKIEFDAWMERAIPPTHDGGLCTAGDWLADPVEGIRADSSDEFLRQAAEEIVSDAAAEDVVLVGGPGAVFEHLCEYRGDLQTEAARGPDKFLIEGYEAVERTVMPFGTGGHAILKKDWVGKRVKVIRLD